MCTVVIQALSQCMPSRQGQEGAQAATKGVARGAALTPFCPPAPTSDPCGPWQGSLAGAPAEGRLAVCAQCAAAAWGGGGGREKVEAETAVGGAAQPRKRK